MSQHPNENVRDMESLERVLRVRLSLGGPPPPSGKFDVDEVGVREWQTVLYCAGSLHLGVQAKKGAPDLPTSTGGVG